MFDLMKLPAEVRIKIYEYALVRDVIRIVSTAHPFGAMQPHDNGHTQVYYEEPNPNKPIILRSRRTSYRPSSIRYPENLRNVKFLASKMVGDEISWSYSIEPDGFPPLVNIFLTSRKVYSETWPIFYQKNAFAFTTPLQTRQSAQNCLSFLYDRPYHALRHVRELHLLIGNAPQHAIRFHLNEDPWRHLLRDISRYMSVRVLVLYFRGRVDDAPNDPSPEWPFKEALCQITGLQELHMDVISESTPEQITTFVKEMRSKMVVGGEQMGSEGFRLGLRSMASIPWTANRPGNSLLTKPNIPDMERHYCY